VHKIPAHEYGEDDDRQHDEGSAGRDLAPLLALVLHEIDDRDWRRPVQAELEAALQSYAGKPWG
jgi:hypothetical protein